MKNFLSSIFTLTFLTSTALTSTACLKTKEQTRNPHKTEIIEVNTSSKTPKRPNPAQTAQTAQTEDIKKEIQKTRTTQAIKNTKQEKTLKEKRKAMSDSNTLNIQLKDGTVKVKLRPDLAPKHVERIKTLTEQGFYDGLKFHRVIDGFMAQTGDPNGDGTGGSELPDLKAEFSNAPFKRGVLGMARSQSPHSANSQFFIMFAESPHLNGQYTVFGEVTEGMDLVDKIKKGPSHLNGSVSNPDVMIKVTLGK